MGKTTNRALFFATSGPPDKSILAAAWKRLAGSLAPLRRGGGLATSVMMESYAKIRRLGTQRRKAPFKGAYPRPWDRPG